MDPRIYFDLVGNCHIDVPGYNIYLDADEVQASGNLHCFGALQSDGSVTTNMDVVALGDMSCFDSTVHGQLDVSGQVNASDVVTTGRVHGNGYVVCGTGVQHFTDILTVHGKSYLDGDVDLNGNNIVFEAGVCNDMNVNAILNVYAVVGGTVSGTTGTFTGAVSGTNGSFTGQVNGSDIIASGKVHGNGYVVCGTGVQHSTDALTVHGASWLDGNVNLNGNDLTCDLVTCNNVAVGTVTATTVVGGSVAATAGSTGAYAVFGGGAQHSTDVLTVNGATYLNGNVSLNGNDLTCDDITCDDIGADAITCDTVNAATSLTTSSTITNRLFGPTGFAGDPYDYVALGIEPTFTGAYSMWSASRNLVDNTEMYFKANTDFGIGGSNIQSGMYMVNVVCWVDKNNGSFQSQRAFAWLTSSEPNNFVVDFDGGNASGVPWTASSGSGTRRQADTFVNSTNAYFAVNFTRIVLVKIDSGNSAIDKLQVGFFYDTTTVGTPTASKVYVQLSLIRIM